MRGKSSHAPAVPVRFAVVTLDAHLAGAFDAARAQLARELPGLELSLHVQAEWEADPGALARMQAAVGEAHFVACAQLFTEEQAGPVIDAVHARRDAFDAVCCAMCTPELTRLTRLGRFDMARAGEAGPWSPLGLIQKLRGSRAEGRSSGERQMTMLRRLPALLKYVPGPAQDVRAYFLTLQYWLGGTAENLAALVRFHVRRYAAGERTVYHALAPAPDPVIYPEVGVWHPSLPGLGLTDDATRLPRPRAAAATVWLLVGRSYLLAGNTAHYAAVVRALEARGLATRPMFASALDARPALARYAGVEDEGGGAWRAVPNSSPNAGRVDALVNLTGFSLVGGPAYNDAPAARSVLAALDAPYLALQTLEFQSVGEWRADARGLNPLQATLQVAIPELDGAVAPAVYGGKGRASAERPAAASEPVAERVEAVADRVAALVRLRRTPRSERKLAVVLFNFPPNAGNTGSAAYLNVFPSLYRTLHALAAAGYAVDVPESVDALRAAVCEGNRERVGAPANVHARVSAERHVAREPWLAELERTWGAAPGKQLTDGRDLFVMGARFGNVFVGVQPAFGWEGDPMRLLFEGGFAPTHAFCAFYRWLREDFGAHAVLHFGTHGALEFMPGKQVGLSGDCWPERLIGALPNVYLYASNNSSEGTLAKRRGAATLVSYLTPPVTNAGLYRGLQELKGTLDRWRQAQGAERAGLAEVVQAQGAAAELCAAGPAWTVSEAPARAETLRARLLEVEQALIPMGLHTGGEAMPPAARVDTLVAMAQAGRPELALPPVAELLAGATGDADARRGADDVARAAIEALVDAERGRRAADRVLARAGYDAHVAAPLLDELARLDALLAGADHETAGILRALDGRYVEPAPGGDLLRTPAVLPTGRNLYGFDPYRVPSAAAVLEGRRRADLLLARHAADGHGVPESVAFVLWGTDNMKSEGAPIAQALALLGAVPRFDAVGRLAGARLVPLAQLGRPRVDVVLTLSGIFRDLLPLQVRLLAEAALLAAQADEPVAQNFVRAHALATVAEQGCTIEDAALRVFGNADGAYGSNVNLLVETGRWTDPDELAEQFVRRKCFAYGVKAAPVARPKLMERALRDVSLSFQNLDSVELGATDIDQYVEALGGVQRAVARAKGAEVPAYLGDHTTQASAVRTLGEQVELESRTRLLNPKWYEAQLAAGYEGARNVAGHVTTTLGWSATGGAGAVPAWVYAEVGDTFVLDAPMRERLAALNPHAANAIAERLLEANDRGYWRPSPEALDALRDAAAELEDRLEGIPA